MRPKHGYGHAPLHCWQNVGPCFICRCIATKCETIACVVRLNCVLLPASAYCCRASNAGKLPQYILPANPKSYGPNHPAGACAQPPLAAPHGDEPACDNT